MNDILAVKLGIRTNWAPHACCSRCSRYLRCWLIGTHQSVPFAFPVLWREQQGHLTERYFCFTKIDGHNRKATRTFSRVSSKLHATRTSFLGCPRVFKLQGRRYLGGPRNCMLQGRRSYDVLEILSYKDVIF